MTIADPFRKRIQRLQQQMLEDDVSLAAIAPTANMRYLLGFAPLMDERLCALLVSPAGTKFVVPHLNADQTEEHTGMETIRWRDDEGVEQVLARALQVLAPGTAPVLAADDTMRADHLILLQEMLAPSRSLPASKLIGPLRLCKSDEEIERLVRSAALADEAMLAGVDACRPGVTERDVGEAVAHRFRQGGASQVDFVIIASGPNGAFPHHETGNRQLQEEDTIILDVGATLNGYKSDITRVVQLGDPPQEVAAAYEAVREANRRGREAVRAGVTANDVDRAARQHLEEAGYGDFFVHRTGHGLGLEMHEPPWIMAGNETTLQPGMVFSIEPGVYLQGKFGIRVEDIVVVTDDGCSVLSSLSRELITKA
ncbi:MAG TPA: Xaa-Pro peptidase family protein [Candidatus Sulfomarinibacteraceae bacterium]|nr:Xaa-Pro peptidase family protein [Candidatus Sulfomarinibacteraceae bacterium]